MEDATFVVDSSILTLFVFFSVFFEIKEVHFFLCSLANQIILTDTCIAIDVFSLRQSQLNLR